MQIFRPSRKGLSRDSMANSESTAAWLGDTAKVSALPWCQNLQERGKNAFKKTGVPGKKTEGWQFSPIEKLQASARVPNVKGEGSKNLPSFGIPRRILLNGSTLGAEVGAMPEGLSLALVTDVEHTLSGRIGDLAPLEHFSALNTAMFNGATALEANAGSRCALHLAHSFSASESGIAYPRIAVRVGKHAEFTLVESFSWDERAKGVLANSVVEIWLEEGARFEHVRLLDADDQVKSVSTVAVHQARDSFYGSRSVSLGGELARTELRVSLAGPGAECELDGVYMSNTGEHVAQQLWVEHKAPHCTSRQRYRGVLDGSGQAVFDGMAFVRPNAQKSEAHQENRNLLLSDQATINTKPHLEIEADDVACSHGATVGALEPNQRFYLQSRGIGAEEANAILTYSFLREILEKISVDSAQMDAANRVLARLPHGASIANVVTESLPQGEGV